ncbi:hypothetical protein [Porcipelethomonas sp.]|uniref:hypothetical protein n=1 Tax=Porcipelethomonas sp. TaxID=2981675 RepID=UPI003EF599F2
MQRHVITALGILVDINGKIKPERTAGRAFPCGEKRTTMKKGLIIGLIAGAAAAVAATVFVKKKKEYDYCDDSDLACDDCCGDCCDCDDDDDDSVNEIPADKTEESVIITDACACGASEEEVLDKVEDTVESDEV